MWLDLLRSVVAGDFWLDCGCFRRFYPHYSVKFQPDYGADLSNRPLHLCGTDRVVCPSLVSITVCPPCDSLTHLSSRHAFHNVQRSLVERYVDGYFQDTNRDADALRNVPAVTVQAPLPSYWSLITSDVMVHMWSHKWTIALTFIFVTCSFTAVW